MWNWKKRKKENIDINAEGSEHIQTRKRNNAGFTLVELMVAVAVFGVMVAPLMSGFVVANRMNNKGRQTEQALTIAQDLMEGVKAFGLESLARQVNDGPITIVSNGSDDEIRSVVGTDKCSTKSYVSGELVTNTSGGTSSSIYTHDNESGVAQYETVGLAEYVYYLEDIYMGSLYYDARIVITQSDNETYLLAQTNYYKTLYFDVVDMKCMKYYDVTVDVYLSDEVNDSLNSNGHRATYTGTILDKS